MGSSRLDQIYRNLLLSKFFVKGWGKPENIKRLFEFRKIVSSREQCQKLVNKNHPVTIYKEEDCKYYTLLHGHFESPFAFHLPELVPPESVQAHFQILLPKKWNWQNGLKPMCIHLAGTGDHYFWRRRILMAQPLLKEWNIGSIILENPFYGHRKPKEQKRSCLHNVSDIFVMGGCLVLESQVLFHWCEQNGLGPIGITGISMGGHMASLAATNWPKPLVLVPCLSWSTASSVFTKGVMSGAIDWSLLENQYHTDNIYSEILQMILGSSSDGCAFEAGRQFAQNYSKTINENLGGNGTDAADVNNQHLSSVVEETFHPHKSDLTDSSRFRSWYKFVALLQISTLTDAIILSPLSNLTRLIFDRLEPLHPRRAKTLNHLERAQAYHEALEFMRGIMDEFTHIANFSKPYDCSSIIIVAARDDAYVPRDGTIDLTHLWPGSEIRYLRTGHIGAYVLHHQVFRKAIKDAFDHLVAKHYTNT